MATDQERRRSHIRKLLGSGLVQSQEHLCTLLKREGFHVTQATLSRDLAKLKARRVSGADGGMAYELADAPVSLEDEAWSKLAALVRHVEANDALVVVKTVAGAASAVALGIDQRRLRGALATLAGDDTIFIAPKRGTSPSTLAKTLQAAWATGDAS